MRGWMDGWTDGRQGRWAHTREFPLKERNSKRETLFLERPPQPSSPRPSGGLPVFLGWGGGTSLGLSTGGGGAFGSAGIPGGGGGRTVGVLWCLPSPGGDLSPSCAPQESLQAPSSLQLGLWSPGGYGGRFLPGTRRSPSPARPSTASREAEPGNIPGKSRTRESPGAPPPPARPAAIGPRRPRPLSGRGHGWGPGATTERVPPAPAPPSPTSPWPACLCRASSWAAGSPP